MHFRLSNVAMIALLAALAGGAGIERLNGGLPGVALDVPYVHTPHDAVTRMLEMAEAGPGDFVIDLGSGDGRIVIAAAREFGARGLGVDIDPARVEEARVNAAAAGVSDRAAFYVENLYDTDLGEADIVTMYLLSSINLKLRPRLLDLRPGTRIASHAFQMGAWRADAMDEVAGTRVYLWIVPAKVGGNWRLTRANGEWFDLNLTQDFQSVGGAARQGNGVIPIAEAALRGDEIRFTLDFAGGAEVFLGRVAGDTMLSDDGGVSWRAERRR